MDGLHLVGGEALVDGGDDGDAAADGRLKEIERPNCRARSKSPARAGQHGLIGGDHVLAAFQHLAR